MINVLVVDDHDLVRTGIARMLADIPDIDVVAEAKSGEEALDRAREHEPHVILMDVKMPGMGGLEATRKLLLRNPECRVVAVSALEDDLYPGRLMGAGAKGYVTKGADIDEIATAIRTVFKGEIYLSAQIAKRIALRVIPGHAPKSSPFDSLSERELQTAMMIVNSHKVAEIADTLSVSPKTVNSYRYRIFEKLDISSDVELTLLAIKHQLLDPESVV